MTFQQQQQQQQQQQHQVQGLGPQQLHQQQQLQLTGQYLGAPLDSITLGQLRSAVNAPQKPKQTYYDYHYDDEDTLFEEINEFYAFVEADQLAENLRVWTSGPFKGEWTKAPLQQRRAFIVTLLEDLEHRDSLTRYNAARRLLYLLQGAFAESMSPEDQMHWIIENAKLVRNAQGVTLIVDALKLLSVKHDQLATISDADLARINTSPLMRQSWIDEVQAEIAICLNILYPIVAFRADDDFAEELTASLKANPIDLQTFREETCVKYPTFLPPPLVVTASTTEATTATNAYGTDRASGISNDSGGGSGLTNLGGAAGSGADGTTSAAAVGTTDPTSNASGSGLRSIDEPPQPPSSLGRRGVATTNNNRGPLGLPTAKLAQALSPLPIRHHYVHPDANTNGNGANGAGGAGSGDDPTGTNAVLNAPAFGSGFVNPPMASTPAPSPPPSPKPKKQQYQTDQTKPFVFPFSSMAYVSSRLVPFAIDEADQLYARHMHVSLALFQTWRTREDFILDESGLEQMPGDQE
ncbi:Factor arrest protein 11, partial [Serendipita sp. 399]